jgi:SAM-dependent methyltransferase
MTIQLEPVPCPKCGGDDSRTVARGHDHLHGLPGEYHASECAGCGLWFLNPRPTETSIPSLYPDEYAPHVSPAAVRYSDALLGYLHDELGYTHLPASEQTLRSRLEKPRRRWEAGVALIPHFVPGGSVLEIGAASGTRLLTLRELGWQNLHGIEMSPAASERARAHGLDVRAGTIEARMDEFPDGSLDVVIASMVLEHLADPFAVVAKVARKLKPGGQFLFATVTRDSADARMFGSYWGGFDFPRHFVFLRDADIADMARDFTDLSAFHHAAPQDFVRPATWRSPEGRWTDRVILRLANSRVRRNVVLALAWSGLTCRVSYRCRKAAR